MLKPVPTGFTLAELLISLAILGMIATFTIPKILIAQQNGKYNAMAKEAASAISGAYQIAKMKGEVTSSFRLQNMTQYLNYVSVDTSGTNIDDHNGFGTLGCTGAVPCYKLHSGGVIMDRESFDGMSSTNAMVIHFDPDGVATDSTTNGPGKSVQFVLFYDGRLTSRGQIGSSFICSGGTWGVSATADPSWFSW